MLCSSVDNCTLVEIEIAVPRLISRGFSSDNDISCDIFLICSVHEYPKCTFDQKITLSDCSIVLVLAVFIAKLTIGRTSQCECSPAGNRSRANQLQKPAC